MSSNTYFVNPKKNIAFIIYSLDSGGAERVVSTLANHFISTYNVTIITIVKSRSFYPLDNAINLKQCMDGETKTKNFVDAIYNNIRLAIKIRSYIKKDSIDVILSFMTTSNVLSLIVSRFLKIPCIISERSNPYIYTQNLFWNKLIRLTYPKASYLVVQSKLIEDYYKTFIDPTKILILPNPISETLSSYKIIAKKRKQVILNVGRLDSNKAQDILIKAFANINYKNWKLIFVGDGELLSYYENLVKTLNLNDVVTFTGNVKHIEDYYNSSSIFAFTSKSEGFPNALVEAMYFEMACVSTNCPTGPSEVIIDNENGFLIDIDSQLQLEDRLQILMDNEPMRLTFGKKAYTIAKGFEINNVASNWNELIIKLI